MFDTFSTKNTSRDDLRKILDYLDSKSIDYSFNGPEEILELDITELSETAQTFFRKKLSRINEGNNEMKKQQAKQVIENFIRREVRKNLNESYGQELDKLQKAFDRCVESMRGSSVMENGPFGIWVDLGVRNQFCDESGRPSKRIK